MHVRKALEVGLKTIGVAIGLQIIFMIGVLVSGLGRQAPGAAGAASAAPPPGQPANVFLWLFLASLIQAAVVTYLVLESRGSGWRITGALFLVVLNVWATQTAIESASYLRTPALEGRVGPGFATRALVTGLVIATLFAPFAVWILGGFRRGTPEVSGQPTHWSAARWTGTLAATTVAFVALYYLCGYYIAWQNPALRQLYSGTTAIRSFWGQMGWTWSSTPWMIPLQAGRGLLFVGMTLPAVRMLRGGAWRVALGTALLYAVWDGSAGLIVPNPIFPPSVAHSHLIELAVWGALFGGFVGWLATRGRPAAPQESPSAKAA